MGLDPGATGGAAILLQRGENKYVITRSTTGESDFLDLLRSINAKEKIVVMEKVGGFIKGVEAPGSAMFKFGDGNGYMRGALDALGWRRLPVHQSSWQAKLSLGKRGTRTKTQWKNHLKDAAARLYPGVKVTLATADALLLLEYGMRFLIR